MTDLASLNLAMTAVSLFNATLLLWLALTVLLNAERRTPGLWAAVGALLLGSLFFLIHTVVVGYGYIAPTFGLNLMWHLAWLPITALPFAWYGVVLWYSGFWDIDPDRQGIHRRHRPWFFLAFALTAAILLAQVIARPLPSLQQILAGDFHASLEIAGIPALLVIYPFFALLCVILTIDALRHPAPAALAMGELARRRARPWLMAASLVLLLVSFMVAGATAWVLAFYASLPFLGVLPSELGLLDLIAAGLIAIAVLLVGQATVSYEIFTGKSLPRNTLRRSWYWAVGLSAVHSLVLSSILQIHFPQVYTILLASLVTVVFLVLQGHDALDRREGAMHTLRPFVASPGFVDHILSGADPDAGRRSPEQDTFNALCREVLNTRQALLAPAGRLALLAGETLVYPEGQPPLSAESLAALQAGPDELIQALHPPLDGWAAWAVPLGSRAGLSGWLLLGARLDNEIYAREQIEFARAAGERLIDQRAGAEMARRLVALQRQRIAESQVLDQRTRRVLHDDILPALHSALLSLGPNSSPEAVAALTESHHQISALLRELPAAQSVVRLLDRLGLVGALRESALAEMDPAVPNELVLDTSPRVDQALRSLPPLAAEVVFYAAREGLRNALRHARCMDGTPARITLAAAWQDGLTLSICDNGDAPPSPAGQPTGPGARQGLALHTAMLAVLGGSLELRSHPGETCLIISLPAQAFPGLG